MEDWQAYLKFPQHRKWFNKLWLSERLGYYCGPAGLAPEEDGWYIIRPVMNLRGMGIGASKVYIKKHEGIRYGAPGSFWCEWFSGRQYSVDYENIDGEWVQVSCYEGVKEDNNLSEFKKWVRSDVQIPPRSLFDELLDVRYINIEYIDNFPIEVHLRHSPDPKYLELIPIWKNDTNLIDKYKKMGYSLKYDYEDCDGFLENPRFGFMVKKEK